MNILKRFSVAHKGLNLGSHTFEFDVDDAFFAAFIGSEIERGAAKVSVQVEKQSQMVTLRFEMKGQVVVPCDRCLDPVELPFEYDGTLYVKYSETEQESDGDVLWISPAETEIPLAQYVYESIWLSLPYQRIHPLDKEGNSTCDPEMLSRFTILEDDDFEPEEDENEEDE